MTNFQKILVNGKEVDASDLHSLPEAVQQVLADKNGNGIPDFLEGILDHPFVKKAMEKSGYTSLDQMPPEMKAKLQGLMQKFGGGSVETSQVHVGGLQSPAKAGVSFSASEPEWKRQLAADQPGSISPKVIIFAMAAILGLLIFAFAVWMMLAGK